ncbi:riboflavin synthase [Halegenticoccus soli]|uniref:riboflavin synthase n=1 Tax=Halegenticoccus soli TaxID=1985678 RepID=UPI000C6ED3E4|nr:riboflavin synthase [Halegenticoccus soli]
MFTGIVEGTGEIVGVEDAESGRHLRIRASDLDDLHHGQSISVSGVCLTVEAFGDDSDEGDPADRWFEVFLAAETVDRTYLGAVDEGDRVNVERALRADGRLDGHVVQGHVDATTTVEGIERVGDDWRFEFAVPEGLERYIVSKGSIALDGISLTVAERTDDRFAAAIIPTTYRLTTLSEKAVGDPVHVEVDVIAKYVERMLGGYRERLTGVGSPSPE